LATPRTIAPSEIHDLIAKVGQQGLSRVVIPPGVYELGENGAKEPWHLEWTGLSKLEIDATGVTFRLTSRTAGGLRFVRCTEVTLKGLRLERATSPISQGVIESVDSAANQVVLQIAAGYPTDIDRPEVFPHVWFNVIDPVSRTWLTHLRAATPAVMTRLGPDRFRVAVETISKVGVPITAGQLVAWRGVTPSDLRYSGCSGMQTLGVTIAGGAGFCFHEMGGEGGNLYRDCSVVVGPRPAGASVDPLLASAADGFHSSDVRRGPTLERCHFERTDDDAVAIHGNYAMVMQRSARELTILVVPFSSDKGYARVGDRLRLYDLQKVLQGETTVTAVTPATGFVPTFSPDDYHQVFKTRPNSTYVTLTCDRDVPAEPGWLLSNPQACGSGYVVRDCTFTDTYARGIIAKASDGLIENCTFTRTARAGVEFNTETGIWSESDYANHVTVRGNRFVNVSLNRKTGLLRHPGALTLFAFHRSNYIVAPGGHREILIENNRFEDNDGPNLLLASAQGVTVRGNTFVRPMQHPSVFGKDKGIDPQSLIVVHQATDVTFSGNHLEQPGGGMAHVLTVTPSCQRVTPDAGLEPAKP
jgi:hypothetical protein